MECGRKTRKVGFDPERDLWCFYEADGPPGSGMGPSDTATTSGSNVGSGRDSDLGGSAGDFEGVNFAGQQDAQMDQLDAISNVFDTLDKAYADASRGNWLNAPTDYTVLDADMQVKNFSPYGRYGIEDTAFFAGAIGEYGLERDILGSSPQGFKDKAVDFVSNVASMATERFGTSLRNNYAIDPSKGYIGEITEDYGFTDLIGNIIGLGVPGGAKVDRYSARELTKTGLGQRQFGNYSVIGGAIKGGYAMSPEEERAMFEAAQAEADAERARGGGDLTVTTGVAAATSQQQLRSALLPSFMQTDSFAFNLLGPDLMPPVYDAAQDFFRSSTLASGGNYFGAFGFAGGGQAGAEQGSDSNVSGPVGFVGDVPEAVSEAGTVADDVPMEVEEGTYILNAAAVEFAGSDDIKKMILEAISEAQRQGVDMQPNVDRIKLDNQVSLLVSRGEVVIPPKIAKIIGYDRLEKINNRGKQEVEKRVQENGQSPEAEAIDKGPMNPAEGMAFAPGGKTSSKSDRYIRPDQREGGIDYSLEMLNLKKKFLEMHTDPPKMPEASEYNDRFAETQRPEAFTGSMLIDFENFLNTQLDTSEQGSSQYMMYQDLMDQAMEEASSQAIDQYYYNKGVEVDGTPTDMTDRDVTEQERVRKAVKEARDPDLAPSFLMT